MIKGETNIIMKNNNKLNQLSDRQTVNDKIMKYEANRETKCIGSSDKTAIFLIDFFS